MELDDDGLRVGPKNARHLYDRRKRHENVWWYEERGGIRVWLLSYAHNVSAWIPLRDLEEYVRVAKGLKR